MSNKYYVATSIINGIAAVVAAIAYKQLSARYDTLMDKYWEGNRQIALYDNEVKELKKRIANTSEKNS